MQFCIDTDDRPQHADEGVEHMQAGAGQPPPGDFSGDNRQRW